VLSHDVGMKSMLSKYDGGLTHLLEAIWPAMTA
jgi:hypothetical protein